MALLAVTSCRNDTKAPADVDVIPNPDVAITIAVNAKLFEIPNPTLAQIEKYTTLFDDVDNSDPVKSDFKNFETRVKPGDKIRWKAEINDENFTPVVENIVYERTKQYDSVRTNLDESKRTNFFNRMVISSRKEGFVQEKVSKELLEGEELWYSYWINFSITDNEGNSKHFSIDPRLKVH